ncbi:MAG: PAS domain S-box protein, partial [Proteobacteria bacterium]|nr:PAS domain S-box protein [Pseudomonadota bacterium]
MTGKAAAARGEHAPQSFVPPTTTEFQGFRQQQSELAEAQRLARIGSWRWDIVDDTVSWSEVLYDIFGLDPSEPPPSYARHAEIYTAESFSRLDYAVQAAVAEGVAYSLDLEIRHSSGDRRWITGRGEAIRDIYGKIIALRGTTQDITERRRASEALAHSQRETQARLSEIEQIYRDTPVGLFAFDREFRFLRINERMAEINGLSVEAHIGRTMWEIIPQLAPVIAEIARPVLESGESVLDVEVHGRTEKAPTTDRNWLINYFPLRDEGGEVVGLFGAVLEITQRKQTEQALRESERHFRLSIRNAPIGKALVGLDGKFVHVNQALSRMLGYTEEALMARTFQDITHPDDLALDLGNVEMLLSGKSDSYQMTKRYIHADGHQVNVQLDVTLLRGTDGQPLHFISQIQDITERLCLQEQQQLLTKRLTLALRTSGIGVWDWHVQSNQIQWDDAMYRIYGLAPSVAIDYEVWRDAVLSDDLVWAEDGLQTAITRKSAEKRSFRIRTPDGNIRYI